MGRTQRASASHGCEASAPPVIGDLELSYEGMELPADPGLTLFAYTAEPGTRSEDGLKLLASWAVTQELEDSVQASRATKVRPGGSDE
jgi:hypothetical protein